MKLWFPIEFLLLLLLQVTVSVFDQDNFVGKIIILSEMQSSQIYSAI